MKKRILLLSFIALGSIPAFAQNVPSYVPSNGLVGWWPFNGNANDESGNGNNGTVNGATLTTDRFGNASSAYSFDGVDDYISLNSVNLPYANSDRTISIWFLKQNNNSIWSHTALSYGSASQSNALMISVGNNNLFTVQGWANDIVTNQTSSNSWENIIFTLSSGVGTIYYNGNLIATQNVANWNTIQSVFYIGTRCDLNSSFFFGNIEDIGIWNRTLTECEIHDLYHAQLSSQAVSAGVDQTICSGDNVTLSGYGGSNYQWNNNVVDGQAFTPTQSNAYVVNGTDTLGCTGIDTVIVTVLENAASTLTQTALDSYTLNGQTYTQSGTYTQTLTSAKGCDSTITLNLTLNFTGIDELGTGAKKLVKITDLNGKIMPRRKNTLMLFIYEDGTVERVVEMEE